MKILLIVFIAFVAMSECHTSFLNHRVARDIPRAPALGQPVRPIDPNPYLSKRQDLEIASSNTYGGRPGRVGPVYTFVKTDPEANFKWGVRHVAGVQYGR